MGRDALASLKILIGILIVLLLEGLRLISRYKVESLAMACATTLCVLAYQVGRSHAGVREVLTVAYHKEDGTVGLKRIEDLEAVETLLAQTDDADYFIVPAGVKTKKLIKVSKGEQRPITVGSVQKFIQSLAPYAKELQRTKKVPASITLAQGILESGAGTSRLAVKGHNHFGEKCFTENCKDTHVVVHDDCKKNHRKGFNCPGERFKFYTGPKEEMAGRRKFLSNSRYSYLYSAQTIPFSLLDRDHKRKPGAGQKWQFAVLHWDTPHKRWAYGLDAVGYATDQGYAKTLLGLIDKYDLTQYDE
jgi:flagellum-specific peptidoglycan hydrolase FlgJ